MTHLDAFLARFDAEPWASWHGFARLVTADWLEEQGRGDDALFLRTLLPDRAEFTVRCPEGLEFAPVDAVFHALHQPVRLLAHPEGVASRCVMLAHFLAGSGYRVGNDFGTHPLVVTPAHPLTFVVQWPGEVGTVGVQIVERTTPCESRYSLFHLGRAEVAGRIRGT